LKSGKRDLRYEFLKIIKIRVVWLETSQSWNKYLTFYYDISGFCFFFNFFSLFHYDQTSICGMNGNVLYDDLPHVQHGDFGHQGFIKFYLYNFFLNLVPQWMNIPIFFCFQDSIVTLRNGVLSSFIFMCQDNWRKLMWLLKVKLILLVSSN
jgi:hypothetical protein